MATLKQTKFVKEYIENGGNATEATIKAGYDVKTNTTARSIGSENLTKPNVRKMIEDACDKLNFTPKEALEEVIVICKGAGKDKLKALALFSTITGMEAPTKTENKTELTAEIETHEKEEIARIARESLKEALN